MNRRAFLNVLAAALAMAGADLPEPSARKLPRWRGFNLLELFNVGNWQPFQEFDFAAMGELGFNFARLPMDYRCWSVGEKIEEGRALEQVDRALELGKTHGIHVQLNFHRAPGYTVASPPEPKSLWTDAGIQGVCAAHWSFFAGRYKGVPGSRLSFNLLNEPAKVPAEAHRKVVELLAGAIRAVDPARPIVCDGREWGTVPPTELSGLNVAAATRGYAPFHLTHYQANWVEGSDRWPTPVYPFREGKTTWDRESMRRDQVAPWRELEVKGVGVMVGEFGAHNRTPHAVVIPWMRDSLAEWKSAGWGWALWNLRGSFGVFDSDRPDVPYEDWRGHKLDRAMLDVLQAG